MGSTPKVWDGLRIPQSARRIQPKTPAAQSGIRAKIA